MNKILSFLMVIFCLFLLCGCNQYKTIKELYPLPIENQNIEQIDEMYFKGYVIEEERESFRLKVGGLYYEKAFFKNIIGIFVDIYNKTDNSIWLSPSQNFAMFDDTGLNLRNMSAYEVSEIAYKEYAAMLGAAKSGFEKMHEKEYILESKEDKLVLKEGESLDTGKGLSAIGSYLSAEEFRGQIVDMIDEFALKEPFEVPAHRRRIGYIFFKKISDNEPFYLTFKNKIEFSFTNDYNKFEKIRSTFNK